MLHLGQWFDRPTKLVNSTSKLFFCGNFYIKAMIEADRSKTPLQTQVHN
jgi:hypothetical protein